MIRFRAVVAALVLLPAAHVVCAQEQGVIWQTTVNMTMTQPVSMAMPAYTSEVCGPAEPLKQPPPMQDGGCNLEDFQRGDARISYKVVCQMEGGTMTGTGWAEKVDADNYKGHMTISGSVNGMQMATEMSYQGQRIGTCTQGDESAQNKG